MTEADLIVADVEKDEETGATRLVISTPGEPKEGERKANRRERRDYIRTMPRVIRLAYGFGKIDRIPGGIFVSPAVPR